jgi:hypothetical protein
MAELEPVFTLWIGPRLSRLERLCIRSFLYHGHALRLFTYDEVEGVPQGVDLCDAADILPRSAIFRYGARAGSSRGGYGGFANLWRAKHLFQYGGFWVDADQVCLRPWRFPQPYVWAWEKPGYVANGVLKLPAGSDLARDLYNKAHEMGQDTAYLANGPKLLTALIAEHGLGRYTLEKGVFYPWGCAKWAWPFRPNGTVPPNAHGMHLWNEMLRRNKVDKDATWDATSVIEQLSTRYG